MAYYNRNNRKKTKNYNPKNRMLRKNCPVHGELVGYTSSFDINTVYEALSLETNKVEHKCFKCLEEPINKERDHNSLVRHKVEEEGHKKFGRKESLFGFFSNFFVTIGFLGAIFTWFFSFGILKAFAFGAFFFVMFILSHRESLKFEKKRTEYSSVLDSALLR